MGKNAARQSADKAGHDGPITSGSNNVTTGSLPAVRLGDSFICKEHGPGVVAEGSKTVTINGLPAARMGDKVICGKKSLPPTKGPRSPEYHYATLAKNVNEDGSLKVKNPNEFRMNVLSGSSSLLDTDGDGFFDSSNSKANIIDYQLTPSAGDSGIIIGGSVGKVEMTSGTINNDKASSARFDAKAIGVEGNIGGSSGKEGSGDYEEIKATGSVGTAEVKGEGSISYDADNMSGGGYFELGVEAAAAKGEIGGSIEYKYLKIKAAVSGTAGSVGAGLGGGAWADIDNLMFRVKLTGELAAILGVRGDTEAQIGPFLDNPNILLRLMFGGVQAGNGAGEILSGIRNVIIGG
ncbi:MULTISPECIES: PAAR domain-containing protein [Enterobacterales]|uniref:PAAR domain-containing protein n=1 Tax=Enterobacterales TaxID=91347 RepID=UPI002ED9C43B